MGCGTAECVPRVRAPRRSHPSGCLPAMPCFQARACLLSSAPAAVAAAIAVPTPSSPCHTSGDRDDRPARGKELPTAPCTVWAHNALITGVGAGPAGWVGGSQGNDPEPGPL